jgi:Fe2+ or Zn2+ uptake regulation protein
LKAVKYSRQRALILNILRSTRSHPNAYWIFKQARDVMPHISLGTVYRNLNFLASEGKIKRFVSEDGSTQYDGDLRDHYHVRCIQCQTICDVPHVSDRVSYQDVEKLTGFKIYSAHVLFEGICPQCLKEGES